MNLYTKFRLKSSVVMIRGNADVYLVMGDITLCYEGSSNMFYVTFAFSSRQ